MNRSSCSYMFFKIGFLKNLANFIGKQKKFLNFLRTPFSTEHLRWLLLNESQSTTVRADIDKQNWIKIKNLIKIYFTITSGRTCCRIYHFNLNCDPSLLFYEIVKYVDSNKSQNDTLENKSNQKQSPRGVL